MFLKYCLVVTEFVHCGVNINAPMLVFEDNQWVESSHSAIDLLVAYSNVNNESLNSVIACLVDHGATVRNKLSFQLILLPQVRQLLPNDPKLARKTILNALYLSQSEK